MPFRNDSKNKVTAGTSNVFADLEVPDATEKNAKAQLAVAVNDILEKRGIHQQSEVGALLGATQPQVSALKNYRLRIFSLERLMDYLFALDTDVEITIRPRSHSSKASTTRVINKPHERRS